MKKSLSILLLTLITSLSAMADNLTATVTHAIGSTPTGTINLTITGGQAPYTVSWTGPMGFTSTATSLTGLLSGNYIVEVTDQHCGIATLLVQVASIPTSINDLKPLNVAVFPNPNTGLLYVNFEHSGKYTIRIINVLGQEVLENQLLQQQNHINIGNLPNGVYTLYITNGAQTYTQQLTKL